MVNTINTPPSNFKSLPVDVCKNILFYLEPIEISPTLQYSLAAIRAVSPFWSGLYWEQVATVEGLQEWAPGISDSAINLGRVNDAIASSKGQQIKRFFMHALGLQPVCHTNATMMMRIGRELCQEIRTRCWIEGRYPDACPVRFYASKPEGYHMLQERMEEISAQLAEGDGIRIKRDCAAIDPLYFSREVLTRWPATYQLPEDTSKNISIKRSFLHELFFAKSEQREELLLWNNNRLKHIGGNISVDDLDIRYVEKLTLCQITAKAGKITNAPNLRELHVKGLNGKLTIEDCPKLERIHLEGTGTLEYIGNYFKPRIECKDSSSIRISCSFEGRRMLKEEFVLRVMGILLYCLSFILAYPIAMSLSWVFGVTNPAVLFLVQWVTAILLSGLIIICFVPS